MIFDFNSIPGQYWGSVFALDRPRFGEYCQLAISESQMRISCSVIVQPTARCSLGMGAWNLEK